jgi:hypothetical protein
MARTVPSAVVSAINAQTTSSVFLVLMDIVHPSFTTVRIVNNTENITSNGNTYTAFPFNVILPPDTEEFQPKLQVGVVNVTRLLIDEVRTIAGSDQRATATITVIEASDPDTALATYSNFEVVNLRYDANEMSFDLIIDTFLTEPFPAGSFTPSTFPGLF